MMFTIDAYKVNLFTTGEKGVKVSDANCKALKLNTNQIC